jgi:hypothetical protein
MNTNNSNIEDILNRVNLLTLDNINTEEKTNIKVKIQTDSNNIELISYLSNINEIMNKCDKWIKDNILEKEITRTKPGSISFLLFGDKPSEQSIVIKLGKFGEFMAKELIKTNNEFELLKSGIQIINNNNKDVDLLFKNKNKNIIYFRELKGNIQLDTEKLPATIKKCKEIEEHLKKEYLNYNINCGILNWSVYNRKVLTSGLSNIKKFENNGVKVDHMEDLLNIIDVKWNIKDYNSYFREIGSKINKS